MLAFVAILAALTILVAPATPTAALTLPARPADVASIDAIIEARYGNIVHVMSAYDSKPALSDEQPFARGVNSIQLWFDGTRWYVVTTFWESESVANPLPTDLLHRP